MSHGDGAEYKALLLLVLQLLMLFCMFQAREEGLQCTWQMWLDLLTDQQCPSHSLLHTLLTGTLGPPVR